MELLFALGTISEKHLRRKRTHLLLFMDLRKAYPYDTVERSALEKVLQLYGIYGLLGSNSDNALTIENRDIFENGRKEV